MSLLEQCSKIERIEPKHSMFDSARLVYNSLWMHNMCSCWCVFVEARSQSFSSIGCAPDLVKAPADPAKLGWKICSNTTKIFQDSCLFLPITSNICVVDIKIGVWCYMDIFWTMDQQDIDYHLIEKDTSEKRTKRMWESTCLCCQASSLKYCSFLHTQAPSLRYRAANSSAVFVSW